MSEPQRVEPDLESRLPAAAYELLDAVAPTDSGSGPFLFSEAEIDASCAAAGKHFTAGWLKKHQPRIYRAIAALSAGGYSSRDIAELLNVSKNTVGAVLVDCPNLVGTLKQRTASVLRRVTLLMAERMLEKYQDIPIGQLAVPLGIMSTHAQLLEGEATAIVETKQSAQHVEWQELLAAAEEAYRQQTDLRRGMAGDKGAVIEGEVTPLPAPGSAVPLPLSADTQSTDTVAHNRVNADSATGFATREPLDDRPVTGGEGVKEAAPHPEPIRSDADGISPKDPSSDPS